MKKVIIIALVAIVAILAIVLIVTSGDNSQAPVLTAQGLYNKISENVTLPTDMISRNSEELDMRYGIDTTKAQDFIFMANSTSYYVDTIAIFKVENSEDRKTIKEQLTTIKQQAMNSMNNYDAEQYKIASDGEVIISGNYVCLFMTNDISKVKSTFNDNI
ncbi:MAG: DUF4358 domain-containing protein [Clostridia bacterium]|nr:DUF4358 domain-containing protein [Clostridia bacterium]